MRKNVKDLARSAVIGALYAALAFAQSALLPGSGSWAIQCRMAEMLCILAFFTPGAARGLAVGCAVFNLTAAGAMPLDLILGPIASYLAGKTMWRLRRRPFLGLFLPGLWNGLIVGAELSWYLGGGFWMNAVYVALGEWIVLLGPGAVFYRAMVDRRLDIRLFSGENRQEVKQYDRL